MRKPNFLCSGVSPTGRLHLCIPVMFGSFIRVGCRARRRLQAVWTAGRCSPSHRLRGRNSSAQSEATQAPFCPRLVLPSRGFFLLLLWSRWSSIHVHDDCLRVGANAGVKPVSVFCIFSGRSVERNNSDVGPPGANKEVVLPKHSGVIWTMTWEILSDCDGATASSSHLPPNQIHPVLCGFYYNNISQRLRPVAFFGKKIYIFYWG